VGARKNCELLSFQSGEGSLLFKSDQDKADSQVLEAQDYALPREVVLISERL
jgi:ethanolamine ammonia-lyase large subunit